MRSPARAFTLSVIVALGLALAAISPGCKKDNPTKPCNEVTVYVTNTGSKYHKAGRSYLSGSSIAINLCDAKARGYGPCSRCKPPE